MGKRRLFWLLIVAFAIGLVTTIIIIVVLGQYPRRVLLSDVQKSNKIIIDWRLPDGNVAAFELDEPNRVKFVRDLTENLGLDYFRAQATVTPTIGIYLVDDKNEFLAYYAIRCARGGGRCPAMESLRNTAAKGRAFSEIEADEIFNSGDLHSKWPHIFPWPECRYDYVLPVVPSTKNPLWEELRRASPPDPRLRYTFKGHVRSVVSVAFSPDGKTLATGSWDKTIKLWDVATGKNTTTLTGNTGVVRAVTYSPDGKMLASAGGNDQTIKLWDAVTGKNIATMSGHKEIVQSVAFSPDGKILASGGWDKTVELWDVATGKNITTLNGHDSPVAFSPDGKTLATGSWDETIKLWDVADGKNIATLNGHDKCVSSVAFSSDGKILASGSSDSKINLWDVARRKSIAILKFPAPSAVGPVAVAFSPDGKTLAAGGLGRKIKLWDVSSGKCIAIFSGQSWSAGCLAFSPDGKTLASGSDHEDNTAKLWDMTLIREKKN
jgi:WD40 repeat protein